ncbi:hypothetical protein N7U66_09315 [Lacinutrix neustonica]|uniref:Uncharacterized protein n=1 Tax=Lacinutrix neustonica TaxID=2980107 RepID=A0A9E8SFB4_9FLAO|nr:hypothetical protein [Lacinutrix neustonica]WAC03632.1 hypothetical protein N7U66_09315 [Lacinutrix neustonica]
MKNLKNLGQALSKAEQKTIQGGYIFTPAANTGYVSTFGGSNYVDECQSADDCPMKENRDGSLMTPSCRTTIDGLKCHYVAF